MLLRHGRTAWNADSRFQGQLDPPLDDAGRAQAAAVGPVVAALRPDLLLTSDLQRAGDTAAQVAAYGGLTAVPEPRLREIDVGHWSGLSRVQVQERFPAEYDAWARGEQVRRGGGETYPEVADRAVAALTEALTGPQRPGLVVAVTHGGTARAVLGRLLELDPAQWWRFSALGNACWSVLVEARAGWRLAEHGTAVRVAPSEAD